MHHFPNRGAHEAGIDRKEGLEGGSCKPNQYEGQYGCHDPSLWVMNGRRFMCPEETLSRIHYATSLTVQMKATMQVS